MIFSVFCEISFPIVRWFLNGLHFQRFFHKSSIIFEFLGFILKSMVNLALNPLKCMLSCFIFILEHLS